MMDAPIVDKEIAGRDPLPAEADARPVELDLAVFDVPDGVEVDLVRDDAGMVKVRARKRRPELVVHQAPPLARGVRLTREDIGEFAELGELDGFRPPDAPVRFTPELSARPRRPRRGEDLPLNVFSPDERRLFADVAFPWRTTGRVWTAGGACAGCTIGPRLVLTASHCIDWDDGEGRIGWVKFSPGYDGGNGPWGEFYATEVIWWNQAEGGLSDLETAFDYVVLVMNEPVGERVGWPGYRTYDAGWNGGTYWQHVGYPGDLSGTQRPSFQGSCVVSSASSQSLSGQTGLVLGHFNDTTPGHSGGPAWGWWGDEPWPRVVGVASAEAATPKRDTTGDNEFGGGQALSALIGWARANRP
jgi:V8-like Glu-specific endopeptidase